MVFGVQGLALAARICHLFMLAWLMLHAFRRTRSALYLGRHLTWAAEIHKRLLRANLIC